MPWVKFQSKYYYVLFQLKENKCRKINFKKILYLSVSISKYKLEIFIFLEKRTNYNPKDQKTIIEDNIDQMVKLKEPKALKILIL